MRINVYTEEMLTTDDGQPFAEITTAEYVSSRTGQKMTNYGLRVFLRSAPQLHYIPGRDDDRSAITFWCGEKQSNVFRLLEALTEIAHISTGDVWRAKVERANEEAIAAESARAACIDPDCPLCKT